MAPGTRGCWVCSVLSHEEPGFPSTLWIPEPLPCLKAGAISAWGVVGPADTTLVNVSMKCLLAPMGAARMVPGLFPAPYTAIGELGWLRAPLGWQIPVGAEVPLPGSSPRSPYVLEPVTFPV